jgi:hypothetical protein
MPLRRRTLTEIDGGEGASASSQKAIRRGVDTSLLSARHWWRPLIINKISYLSQKRARGYAIVQILDNYTITT